MKHFLLLIAGLIYCLEVYGQEILPYPSTNFDNILLKNGYDVENIDSKIPCINGKEIVSKNIKSKFYLDRPLSSSDILGLLYPDYSLDHDSVLKESSYKTIITDGIDKKSVVLYYLANFTAGIVSLSDTGLSKNGLEYLKKYPVDKRTNLCGSHFVNKIELGGNFIVTVKLRLRSQMDADRIKDIIQHENVPFYHMNDRLRQIGSQYDNILSLEINLSQNGGNLTSFHKYYGANGGIKNLNCTYPDIEPCIKTIDMTSEYLSLPEHFRKQIKDSKYDPSSSDSAQIIRYNLEKINTVRENFTRDIARVMPNRLSRHKINKLYLVNSTAQIVIKHLILRESNLVKKSELAQIKKLISSNLDIIKSAIKSCKKDFLQCESAYMKVTNTDEPVPIDKIIPLVTFKEYCNSRYKKPDILRFFTALKEKFRDSDCNALFEILINENTVSLSGYSLVSIKPLLQFSNISFLDLSDNSIEDFNLLKYLYDLRALDVSQNGLRSIDFSPLKNLKELNIDRNQIKNIKQSDLPGSLAFFRAVENPLTNLEKIKNKIKYIKNLYLLPEDVCRAVSLSILDSGVYTREEMEASLNKGLGPDFTIVENRVVLKGWKNCISHYKTYGNGFWESRSN